MVAVLITQLIDWLLCRCVHSEDGVDTVSDPMTVVVKAKEPKEEKVKPEKEKKEKKKKGSI